MSEETMNDSFENTNEESIVVIESTKEPLQTVENLKGKIVGLPETTEGGVIGSSSTNRKATKKAGALGRTNNGAIGSVKVDKQNSKVAKQPGSPKKETVAIFSTKNVSWEGVGSVSKGFNFVSQEKSEKWLTRNHVRLATPKEVAEEYGV
jgi:hypothetical protein